MTAQNIEGVPFVEVKEFIREQLRRGRYNRNTAQGMQTACTQILPLLEASKDTVGQVKRNLDSLMQRYSNLHPKVGKASLDACRQRVARAIEDYAGHRTDPEWQPQTREGRKGGKGTGTPSMPAPTPQTQPSGRSTLTSESVNVLRHRLPLRADFDVERLLPRDFTAKEARRVVTWITALAEPNEETS